MIYQWLHRPSLHAIIDGTLKPMQLLGASMDQLQTDGEFLLNTRFRHVARNTIDYWMLPDSQKLNEQKIIRAMSQSLVAERSTFQLYLHIPFCAQSCSFCAFSGGNSLDFASANEYVKLLILQLDRILEITLVYGRKRIRSVHIGGGSPDLLQGNIGRLLTHVQSLTGIDGKTEIAVECAPSTTKKDFLDECIAHNVTKLSFGIQSTCPEIRRSLRMPRSLRKVEEVSDYVSGQIPIVNADLITGLPGQNLNSVDADLRFVLKHPVINAVSTYLLTPGAAPSLIADVKSGRAPQVPSHKDQALMRLHSYSTLQQAGWVRRGTNTYIDRNSVSSDILDSIPGNECIGAAHYDSFLIAAGSQAIGSCPGVRYENIVNIHNWQEAIRGGQLGFNFKKSATKHQKDMSLWTFPLFYQGLSKELYNKLIAENSLEKGQIDIFNELLDEGLILSKEDCYELSILGEIFMGHIVYLVKKNKKVALR